MRKLFWLAMFVPIVAVAVPGCGERSAVALPNNPVASIPVDVVEVDYAGLDAVVKQQQGKVVLIDFWATWCPPCREYFPDHVARHKKYAPHGLVCMSVSLNKLWPHGEYSKEPVHTFLKNKNAAFPNFVAMGDEQKIAERFGLGDRIPFMVMFDKTGKRVWDTEQDHLSDRALDKLIEKELVK